MLRIISSYFKCMGTGSSQNSWKSILLFLSEASGKEFTVIFPSAWGNSRCIKWRMCYHHKKINTMALAEASFSKVCQLGECSLLLMVVSQRIGHKKTECFLTRAVMMKSWLIKVQGKILINFSEVRFHPKTIKYMFCGYPQSRVSWGEKDLNICPSPPLF